MMTISVLIKTTFALTFVSFIAFSFTPTAYAGNSKKATAAKVKKSNVKKPHKSAKIISAPTNAKKATGPSPQRAQDLKNAVSQHKQAKQNLQRELGKLKQPNENYQTARRNLANAQKAAQGLSKDKINAMPTGKDKTNAFNLTRQVKWATNEMRKAEGALQRAQQSPSLNQAKLNLQKTQNTLDNASQDYMVSWQKRSVHRAVSAKPQGINAIQRNNNQVNSRSNFSAPKPVMISNVRPPQTSANVRPSQGQRVRQVQPLPKQRIYDKVPPLSPKAGIIYSQLPAMTQKKSEQLNRRDAQGRPIGLYNPLQRRMADFSRQQQLYRPIN